MKRIIVDVETDGLQWTKCWVVVTRDLDTDEVKTFRSIHNAGLAMNSLRNHKSSPRSNEPCKEAFDYDDDVTVEAIESLREKADAILKKGNWKVVEGHGVAK